MRGRCETASSLQHLCCLHTSGIETDTGILGFTFNGQTISVALTGNGVSIIPTSVKSAGYNHRTGDISIIFYAEGDIIPNGEQVSLFCIDATGLNEYQTFGTLQNNKSIFQFGPPEQLDWVCGLGYEGDPEFAGSGVGMDINQCRPVKSCWGN